MSKQTESPALAENVQRVVYILTRWGQIYAVYENLEDAQQVQRTMIAKGQVVDISTQIVKSKMNS